MDPDRLKELLENPDSITAEHISELETLASTYPYFQAVKVLLAKVVGSSETIKSAAAITADRTILMQLLKGTFDQDVNIPNLNDLDIDTEVNAFDQLQEQENQEATKEDVAEPPENNEVASLLDSFEEEAEKEETSLLTTDDETKDVSSESSDSEVKEHLQDFSLSDNSTEDYKLPDYNYNFDTDDNDNSNLTISTNEKELDWKEAEDESILKDFENQDLQATSTEGETETTSVDEEDKFRSELMESLADLNRIRQENAEIDINNEQESVELKTTIQEEVEHTALVTMDAEPEAEIEPAKEDNDELAKEEQPATNGAAEYKEKAKHVIESLKQTETISDTNPMFDDNLFELNHLIDADKKALHANKSDGGTHIQKEVIDRFINTIPELTAQNHDNREYSHLARDLYDKSVYADTTKMTETMAKLMITQGKLPRAIEIYEHLMLKYPEKKTYFASLIEKIREDI